MTRTVEKTIDSVVYTYDERMPREYDLLHVLPEFDVVGMSRPEYRELIDGKPNTTWGLPPTVKLYDLANVPFYRNGEQTDAYRLLLHLFVEASPRTWTLSYIEKKMLGYLRNGVCYTDHTDPTGWNQIVTCGNVLYPTGNKQNKAGELHWEVRQLKMGSYGYMMMQIEQYPYLVAYATNSTRDLGGQRVDPFPHCGGNSVPAPLLCKTSTNWIKDSRVRLLDRDELIPYLYYPKR